MLNELLQFQSHNINLDIKSELFSTGINHLHNHHINNCEAYKNIVDGFWPESNSSILTASEIPFIPVGLFKRETLISVPELDITMTLHSSGTTGQSVSRIHVDKITSMNQQRCLSNSVQHMLGKKRLPMLVVDTPAVIKDPALLSARGAGVLGMMKYGYRPVFLLKENGETDELAIHEFLKQHEGGPFFIFGFTFMVWLELYEKFKDSKYNLSNGILIHSGGWKKLIEKSVDNDTFREKLNDSFGLKEIYNFYGMVEQIGSIFVEGENGLLFPPNFTEVIIRDPITWKPAPKGSTGIIQVLSLIPFSYPGHSLLTEDLGYIESVDTENGVRHGLRIVGRVPKAELRGCSDVIASNMEAQA